MSELLPCPFCGGDPLIHDIEPHKHAIQFGGFKMPDHQGSTVIEGGCGCGLIDNKREEVIARWNRRASPAANAEDRKDAERYRGIRTNVVDIEGSGDGILVTSALRKALCRTEAEFDASIDAAMSKDAKGEDK